MGSRNWRIGDYFVCLYFVFIIHHHLFDLLLVQFLLVFIIYSNFIPIYNYFSIRYVHKNTCTDVAWNDNGNWFLTASRDHLIKLFDLRNLKSELQTFRGHKRDVMRVAWHPFYECLFASGSADGAIFYWLAGYMMICFVFFINSN